VSHVSLTDRAGTCSGMIDIRGMCRDWRTHIAMRPRGSDFESEQPWGGRLVAVLVDNPGARLEECLHERGVAARKVTVGYDEQLGPGDRPGEMQLGEDGKGPIAVGEYDGRGDVHRMDPGSRVVAAQRSDRLDEQGLVLLQGVVERAYVTPDLARHGVEVPSQLNGLSPRGRAIEIDRPERIPGGIELAGGCVKYGVHMFLIERLDAGNGGGVGFLMLR
jgi:hypothetical protein